MDKGLTVQKWVLINQPRIPQMPQNLSAQIVFPSPKVWDFDERRLQGQNAGVTAVVPKFSDTLTLFQPTLQRSHQRFPHGYISGLHWASVVRENKNL